MLSGSIPAEFVNLVNSDIFSQNNRLSGTIPAEIGALTNLITLNLSHKFEAFQRVLQTSSISVNTQTLGITA